MKKNTYIEEHIIIRKGNADLGCSDSKPFCVAVIQRLRRLFKKHSLFLFAFQAICFFSAGTAFGQPASVKASLNKDHVLIGEPVELKVEVRTTAARPLIRWFNLPDSFNHLEILNRSPLDSVAGTNFTTYRQTLTITGFDQGIWMIPAVAVSISQKTVHTDSLALTIVSVQLKDSAYHDIREIIDVPNAKTPWWYWVAGILSVAALGILLWLWIKSRSGKPVTAGVHTSTLSPLEEAMNGLRALEAEQLANNEEWKKHYSILTGIFKIYVERRFNIPALQKTTDELLLLLNGKLDKTSVSQAAEVLRISDAVKFAKYQPGHTLASASLHTTEKVIRALDHLKQ